MGIFDSLIKLTEDVVTIAIAPINVTVDATRIVTKPVADLAKEVTKEVKETVEDLTKD